MRGIRKGREESKKPKGGIKDKKMPEGKEEFKTAEERSKGGGGAE